MSTVTAQTPTGAAMNQWLGQLIHFYCRDLEALADAHIYSSIGGKARSAHDFTTEVAMMMDWTTEMLGGALPPMPSDEHKKALEDSTRDKAALIKLIQDAGGRLSEALLKVDQERLDTMIEAPFGMTMPAVALTNIFVNHLWYHDGQLCLIQAFHGDEEMHWM